MTRPFLTARWSDVVLVNYRVPAALLLPHVPPGSELDTPEGEPGLHLLSLVALRFTDIRVWGIPFPTARAFAEVNLRFYAGAVPCAPPSSCGNSSPRRWRSSGRASSTASRTTSRASATGLPGKPGMSPSYDLPLLGPCRGDPAARPRRAGHPSPGQRGPFPQEALLGIRSRPFGESFRYRVAHPLWRTYPVENAAVTIDPGALLGGAWRAIDWEAARHSILFAEGSHAAVYGAEPLIEEGYPVAPASAVPSGSHARRPA